jgi:hypothetical protein
MWPARTAAAWPMEPRQRTSAYPANVGTPPARGLVPERGPPVRLIQIRRPAQPTCFRVRCFYCALSRSSLISKMSRTWRVRRQAASPRQNAASRCQLPDPPAMSKNPPAAPRVTPASSPARQSARVFEDKMVSCHLSQPVLSMFQRQVALAPRRGQKACIETYFTIQGGSLLCDLNIRIT